MNERIRELMAQAGFDPDAIQRMGIMPQAGKFVELIIQECLELCKDAENAFLMHGMQEREALGAITVQEYIKEHFGVE